MILSSPRMDYSIKSRIRGSIFTSPLSPHSQSQWPSGLRHELSSLALTLGLGFRIPLKTWMSVCVYSVCRKRPCDALIPRPRIPTERCVGLMLCRTRHWLTEGCRTPYSGLISHFRPITRQ
jgi:hypothetical protein